MLWLLCFLLQFLLIKSQNDYSCRSYGFLGPREIKRMNSNCTEIHGHIYVLTNKTSYNEMMRVFSSVKVIYGCVNIRNTTFKDLYFFENLEQIICTPNEIQAWPVSDAFALVNNHKLEVLGMNKLKSISGPSGDTLSATIEGTSPKFCLSDVEYDALFESSIIIGLCSGNPNCLSKKPPSNKVDGSQIPENCSLILWNIFLRGNISAEYLDRLKSKVLGIINVTETNIETLNMPKLKLLINPYNNEYPVRFDKNYRLTKIVFDPAFKAISACIKIFISYDYPQNQPININFDSKSSLVDNCAYCV